MERIKYHVVKFRMFYILLICPCQTQQIGDENFSYRTSRVQDIIISLKILRFLSNENTMKIKIVCTKRLGNHKINLFPGAFKDQPTAEADDANMEQRP